MAHACPVTLIYSTNHKVPRRFLLGAALLSLLVAAVIFIHLFFIYFFCGRQEPSVGSRGWAAAAAAAPAVSCADSLSFRPFLPRHGSSIFISCCVYPTAREAALSVCVDTRSVSRPPKELRRGGDNRPTTPSLWARSSS